MVDAEIIRTIVVAAISGVISSAITSAIAWQRMNREFRLHNRAEAVAHELLSHPHWKWRSFTILRHHLGGFTDDELRKILVQAGAVRFETAKGLEIWGLYKRVGTVLKQPRYPTIGEPFTVASEVSPDPP